MCDISATKSKSGKRKVDKNSVKKSTKTSSEDREQGPRERARLKLQEKKKKQRQKNAVVFTLSLLLVGSAVGFYRFHLYEPPVIPEEPVIALPDEDKQEGTPVSDVVTEEEVPEIPIEEEIEEEVVEEIEEVLPPIITTKILDTFHCDDQRQTLPEGCEVTSLAAVLHYHGVETDKMVLSEQYLPRSGLYDNIKDPDAAYIGNPASYGWYCFEAPLVVCANNYLADVGSNLRAEIGNITEKQQFIDYINSDTPVIVWLTTNYGMPYFSFKHSWYTGTENTNPYYNLHVVSLVGYSEDEQLFYIADSLKPNGEEFVELNMDTFMEIYEAMNTRSVVVS